MSPRFESPPASPNSFSRPRPRPPRSPGHSALIRAQNRRRAYLESHREYFISGEHELADPLLYDFLIRRFQTPAEREADGRAKGYARVLEGSLLRGEERLAKLRAQTVERNGGESGDGEIGVASSALATDPGEGGASANADVALVDRTGGGAGGVSQLPVRGTGDMGTGAAFSSLSAELTPPARTREEGRAQWEEFLRDRFIRGEDEDFDYAGVDGDDAYDVLEREDREEAWFEEEDPEWASSGDSEEAGGAERGGEGRQGEKSLQGETGIQDF